VDVTVEEISQLSASLLDGEEKHIASEQRSERPYLA
jgi:hypothetical protein